MAKKSSKVFLRAGRLTPREKFLIVFDLVLLAVFLSMLFPRIVYSGFI